MFNRSLRSIILFGAALLFAGCGNFDPGSVGSQREPVTSRNGDAGQSAASCTYVCAIDCVCKQDANGCDLPECADSFACGSTRCGAGTYCEVVHSDVPELNGSYSRYQCKPLPACTAADVCSCIESAERCQVGSAQFRGTCVRGLAGGTTLTCDIGG